VTIDGLVSGLLGALIGVGLAAGWLLWERGRRLPATGRAVLDESAGDSVIVDLAMRAKRLLPVLAALVGLPLAVWTCVVIVYNPSHYIAVVDELAVPASWELAHTEIKAPGLDACVPIFGNCPSVTRYYLLDADPGEVVAAAKEIVRASGFTVDVRVAPRDWCDPGLLGATPRPCPTKVIEDCVPNGRGGPVTCWVTASRGQDRLTIVISDRGERATYYVGSESHFVGAPNRSVAAIRAGPHD